MDSSIASELHECLEQLPEEQQLRVLEYARTLASGASKTKTRGSDVMRFAGSIAPDDLAEIQQAIAEGCEQVDSNEW